MPEVRFILFVYGGFLRGEPDHGILERATFIRTAQTVTGYGLYEMGALAGLYDAKSPVMGSVSGELYSLDYPTLVQCDQKCDHPSLFHRAPIRLDDETEAEAYLLTMDQVRGRRRVKHGHWRDRFHAVRSRDNDAPIARWARSRF